MRILLTGCTGFVGKFVLRDLLLRAKKDDVLLCLLRGKKGQTAQQRWLEFQTDSLFAGLDFSNAQVVEGDLSSLADLTLDPLRRSGLEDPLRLQGAQVHNVLRYDE
jgi:thioester reductase-like protein